MILGTTVTYITLEYWIFHKDQAEHFTFELQGLHEELGAPKETMSSRQR